MRCGLVSVSFRGHSPEEIIRAAKEAGLSHIEWGSDVHAPANEPERLSAIAAACRQAGIGISSYGTYFRLGETGEEALEDYFRAAEILGTKILRLWCGTKGYAAYSEAEWQALIADGKKAAARAEKTGFILCMECHPDTVTDCLAGALRLMQEVGSPNFLMYWQPHPYRSFCENLRYASAIAPYTKAVHIFHWRQDDRLPLADAVDEWRDYVSCFDKEIFGLLEFMPDGRLETLKTEAKALDRIAEVSR